MPDRVEHHPQFLSVGIDSRGEAQAFDGLQRTDFEIGHTDLLRRYFGVKGEDIEQILSEAIRSKRDERE